MGVHALVRRGWSTSDHSEVRETAPLWHIGPLPLVQLPLKLPMHPIPTTVHISLHLHFFVRVSHYHFIQPSVLLNLYMPLIVALLNPHSPRRK
jgi:hypothetical protein